jgi:hypothetical protein
LYAKKKFEQYPAPNRSVRVDVEQANEIRRPSWKQLKSDDVINLLERDDLDVIYAFARLHENHPDFANQST